MVNLRDIVKRGRCVDATRVPCKKAQDYLKKKGLLCKVDPPKPKPVPAKTRGRKKKGFWETWFW